MDMTMMVQPVVSWIESRFSGQDRVSKSELVSEARTSDLPQEAKETLAQLPEGEWSKDELIGKVRGMFSGGRTQTGVGGGMGGFGTGGMGGGGGYR